MHFLNLLHTMTVYANRWGGPRYRTEEFAKFLHKHLYNAQEAQLMKGEKVNLCLSIDALLSSRHIPVYVKPLMISGSSLKMYHVVDELGYSADFHSSDEILIYRDDAIMYEKVENLVPGDKRIINLELVDEFSNDKLHHHSKFSENFLTIKCKDEAEAQMTLCDALTSMTVVKKKGLNLTKIDQFDKNNIQEIYLIDIVEISTTTDRPKVIIEIMPFSYSLHKNKALSNKSEKRYYKSRQSTVGKRYLEKMRSKVFSIKKDRVKIELELMHAKD